MSEQQVSETHEELEMLLVEWETKSLDAAGLERLREILRNSAEARTRFVQLQLIHAALQQDGSVGLSPTLTTPAEAGQPDSPVPQQRISRRRVSASVWIAGALSLLVFLLAGWIVHTELQQDSRSPEEVAEPDESPVEPKEATSQGIALVTRLVEIEWADDQPVLEVGDALSPGPLKITSGFAQIEFFCGATVIVEGPAELELHSATLAKVRSGRLRAQVPPAARGFTLAVDELKVVDLGTEFALAVSDEGANVQVFEGEVELHEPAEEKRNLRAGQSVTRTTNGGYQITPITPEQFVDIPGLKSRVKGQQSARYQRWKTWSEQLRRDPRLIAYYGFENKEGWDRRLHSDLEPENRDLDGAIVGARPVTGRWEMKDALEFKQPADRVRVQIPGEFGSLTFACWVKIDSLDRWYNSLFLTDHYNQGEPHWQILDTGQLFFSVRAKPDPKAGQHLPGPTHKAVLSPSFWKPSLSGRWLHLATTYNVQTQQITHYLNGTILHQETIPDALLIETTRIGAASIGNWSLPTKPDAAFAIRNLNGSLDEFAIFAAALDAEEIQEMYQHGKP